jgi:hypothetical protein
VEVPIAEEEFHGIWNEIDYSNSDHVVDGDYYRSRKTVSSAFQFKFGTGSHFVFWYACPLVAYCTLQIDIY